MRAAVQPKHSILEGVTESFLSLYWLRCCDWWRMVQHWLLPGGLAPSDWLSRREWLSVPHPSLQWQQARAALPAVALLLRSWYKPSSSSPPPCLLSSKQQKKTINCCWLVSTIWFYITLHKNISGVCLVYHLTIWFSRCTTPWQPTLHTKLPE